MEQARTVAQVQKSKYEKDALDKVLAALTRKFMKQGYCEKYSRYLSYCEGGLYKELSKYLDITKGVEWTTRIEKKEQ